VMNAMGYAASAIGNHEFDFGLQTLEERINQAQFPYLSANLRYKHDGSIPTDIGIQPYTIVEAGELKVGIIGLSTLSTPQTTNPVNLIDFEFKDYEGTLREFVPQAREDGAQVIFVIAHICADELRELAQQVDDLGIPFMGGGHCHQPVASKVGETVIAASGANYVGYAFTQLEVSADGQSVQIIDYGTKPNHGGQEDPEIAEIVTLWEAKTDSELDKEIGYLQNEIPRQGKIMQTLITETWLVGYPTADIALTNLGGMRDRLPAGELTIAEIISVMPFNNVLVDVKLTGAQITQILKDHAPLAIGGAHYGGGQWLLNKSGHPIQADQIYSVLVNDFMYAGGDGFDMLARFDPYAYDTAINWRQPVIDWITAQGSNPNAPLGLAIEALGK